MTKNISANIDFIKLNGFTYKKSLRIPRGEVWLNKQDFEDIMQLQEIDPLEIEWGELAAPENN